MRTPQQQRDPRRGQAMVEFALVFVAFMVLIAGLFDVGRTMWAYHTLTYAAKEASRYAMVHGAKNPIPDGGVTVAEYAKSRAIGLDRQAIQVVVSNSPDNSPGSTVTVQMDYTIGYVAGGLVGLGNGLPLRGLSTKTIIN